MATKRVVLYVSSLFLLLNSRPAICEENESAPVLQEAAIVEPATKSPEDAMYHPEAQPPPGVELKTAAEEPGTATVGPFKIRLGGYLREHLSFNLQDPPETSKNDRFDISMARSTLQLESDISKGDDIKFHIVGRVAGEIKTDYLARLEALGGGHDYNSHASDIREFFVELKPSDRVQVRLGKQQIVWGETDFFQAMDLVQGYDYTWRSFLEGENEDYRKPLITGNLMVQVPEAGGALQLFVRPGLDSKYSIGNTYDLDGGRWANQPNKGVNFFKLGVPYNYRHPDGNVDDVTGGVRWTGLAGPINYSLAWLRTLGPNPVVNPNSALGGQFYKSQAIGALGEFFYPKVDVFGVTASVAPDVLNAVFSTEIAYTKDQLFNVGTNFLGGTLPGFQGVIAKDTLRYMVRMDKQLDLTSLLGTTHPSFFSVQFFDTVIMDYKGADDIVDMAGYGGAKKEHSAIATMVLGLNYLSDRINPQLAGGYDISYGGGFLIPSVSFAFGDKWRLNVEADLFFPKSDKKPGEVERDTHLLGYFSNNSQLSTRLTYQF